MWFAAPSRRCANLNRRCNMIRLALGALVVWGTMSVAACDQAGNEHQILAATVAAPAPEVRQEFLMPVHATATAQLSGCNSAAGVAVSLNGERAGGPRSPAHVLQQRETNP